MLPPPFRGRFYLSEKAAKFPCHGAWDAWDRIFLFPLHLATDKRALGSEQGVDMTWRITFL